MGRSTPEGMRVRAKLRMEREREDYVLEAALAAGDIVINEMPRCEGEDGKCDYPFHADFRKDGRNFCRNCVLSELGE